VQFNAPSRFLEEIPAELKFEVAMDDRRADSGRVWASDGPRGWRSDGAIARRNQAANPYNQDPGDGAGFAIGARVRHPVWGVGTIQTAEGEGDEARVVVVFRSAGTKKLAVKFARLEPA
jgi:DNA helicase-2/ATP-dependent DNA helicase PcrA